jgi:hypothetical protein
MKNYKGCNCIPDGEPDSCWICQEANVYPGFYGDRYSPPEPPEIECNVEDSIFWDNKYKCGEEDIIAANCKYYKRKSPTICRYCSEEY